MSSKTALELMTSSNGVNEAIGKLVELQRKSDAGPILSQLNLSFVDINHIINLLAEYDKILETNLRRMNTEWPPNLDGFLWEE